MAWVAVIGILLAGVSALGFRAWGRIETVDRTTLDASEWVIYRDEHVGWSIRYPPEWRLQIDEGGCAKLGDPHSQMLVTNLSRDLQHPDLGPSSCSDLWDMRELPSSFVVIEVETPGGPPPMSQGSVKGLPLSLKDFRPGHRAARWGVPAELWAPVWIDLQHQYFVRVWLGPDVLAADRKVAGLIVNRIRFSAYRSPPSRRQAPACRAEDLELIPQWGAALGSYGGTWRFINHGSTPCQLPARPRASLLGPDGSVVLRAERPATDLAHSVTLEQGQTATAILLWSNWCRDDAGPFRIRISFDEGALTTKVPGTATCTGSASAGSTLTIQGFQAARR